MLAMEKKKKRGSATMNQVSAVSQVIITLYKSDTVLLLHIED